MSKDQQHAMWWAFIPVISIILFVLLTSFFMRMLLIGLIFGVPLHIYMLLKKDRALHEALDAAGQCFDDRAPLSDAPQARRAMAIRALVHFYARVAGVDDVVDIAESETFVKLSKNLMLASSAQPTLQRWFDADTKIFDNIDALHYAAKVIVDANDPDYTPIKVIDRCLEMVRADGVVMPEERVIIIEITQALADHTTT